MLHLIAELKLELVTRRFELPCVDIMRQAKGATAVCTEDRDRYMLTPCHAKPWVTIELCDYITVEAFEIANFELFSSVFENISVYAHDKLVNDYSTWYLLGHFRAMPERTVQFFRVQSPRWARFVHVRVDSSYGKYHFCPISVIRVYGRTMVEHLSGTRPRDDDNKQIQNNTTTMDSNVISNKTEPQHIGMNETSINITNVIEDSVHVSNESIVIRPVDSPSKDHPDNESAAIKGDDDTPVMYLTKMHDLLNSVRSNITFLEMYIKQVVDGYAANTDGMAMRIAALDR